MTTKPIGPKYRQLLHAMQSGVAMLMNFNPKETEPKHLRVGINAAMCDHSALVSVLIDKGLLTQEELEVRMEEIMTTEVAGYREQIAKALNTAPDKIVLV